MIDVLTRLCCADGYRVYVLFLMMYASNRSRQIYKTHDEAATLSSSSLSSSTHRPNSLEPVMLQTMASTETLSKELINIMCSCLADDREPIKSPRLLAQRFSQIVQHTLHILYQHPKEWQNVEELSEYQSRPGLSAPAVSLLLRIFSGCHL